jgi:citrate synthase
LHRQGIRFRGYTIPEVQKLLPKAPGGSEPLPEGLFWLLCTGEVPSQAQVAALSADLERRAKLPEHVKQMIANFPKHMHPMTQFSAAVLALQTESVFAKAYRENTVKKNEYWVPALEDALNLLANIPEICSLIYRHTFHGSLSHICVVLNVWFFFSFCRWRSLQAARSSPRSTASTGRPTLLTRWASTTRPLTS